MEKVKVTQDALYEYLVAHDVKEVRLAEFMGKSQAVLNSSFRHHKNCSGYERNFSVENIARLNRAIAQFADELRGCVLTFGSSRTYTNKWGRTYDPALVEGMNALGHYLNITALVERILGWNKRKKMSVLTDIKSKAYGNVSEADMMAVNSEVLAVAGVLGNVEVVPDADAFGAGSIRVQRTENQIQTSDTNNNRNVYTQVRSVLSGGAVKYPWDDTSFDLFDRYEAFHRAYPDGMIFFRVNNGFTVCQEDAALLTKIDSTLKPYMDPYTGHVTLYLDKDKFQQIRRVVDDEFVAVTSMYADS